jgi:hypothetical protein
MMLTRMWYYRIWLAIPLFLPLVYAARMVMAESTEQQQQMFTVGLFLVFGWLPYACTAVGYYAQSCRLTADEMRIALVYAPLRMLLWVLGVFVISSIFLPYLLIGLPFAMMATVLVGYAFVGVSLGLEAILRMCNALRADG